MATWITHLRIAGILQTDLPALPAGMFALGNLAPDSGIPDEKWERFDPPPEVTHVSAPPGSRYPHADRDFWVKYLAEPRNPLDPHERAFLLGYFCHLLTDNLWREEVGIPTRARFASQFAADPDFIWEVKKDWYGLDHLFLRKHPDFLPWQQFLETPPCAPYLDFLPETAIRQQMAHIKTYYTTEDDEVREMLVRPWIYLTEEEIAAFVNRSARRIGSILIALENDQELPITGASFLENHS